MMTTYLFVIANVKQLQTHLVLEFYCLFSEHFWVLPSKIQQFLTNWGVGIGTLNIFCSVFNPVRLSQNFGISGGGRLKLLKPPFLRHCNGLYILCLSNLKR